MAIVVLIVLQDVQHIMVHVVIVEEYIIAGIQSIHVL